MQRDDVRTYALHIRAAVAEDSGISITEDGLNPGVQPRRHQGPHVRQQVANLRHTTDYGIRNSYIYWYVAVA